MPSSQFQFDEEGDFFYCFTVAAYTIILIPVTYWCWPRPDPKDHVNLSVRFSRVHTRASAFVVNSSWIFLIYLLFKLSQLKERLPTYDPFFILGIDRDASPAEIRKAYKQLSLKNHPDKGGDEKLFIKISKAYGALTNEETRKNWQDHGDPDGPGAANFGIALPKWMVAKENKFLVIGFYVFLFLMGTWWSNTMKYCASNVMMSTKRCFLGPFLKNYFLPRRMCIFHLSQAHEFSSQFNKEIVARPSDNIELPPQSAVTTQK